MVRTGTGRVVPWACDATRNAGELKCQSRYGPGAKLNLPQNLSKYLGMLEQDAAKKQLEDFFEDRLRSPVLDKCKDRA
ncbi:hypothetical protein NDA11_007576 [Ustilago hordei]|uniref:Uncharacterized protein n=1 Tax=Ustilago hordei TaxID=120017 RepID=I2FT08_USTHO|nr:uncharacterized protein UHO2_06069 [Ustilago hordei]KAJ1043909.1 hypothetical protein NDA10_000417 [Ustilago hordei]KAJ1572526.1 hypothetical protein NDA12_004918 [Ustilago hordei]KAJ1576189.1 hypothetical protein NDA15_004710 [Ustilago hordei]KAJ1593923.1 hypothetical protein NDA11_007576 [Ustilago hordei]KAJ1595350.1 hypothetical protein NDA14_002521 [Ustilago hordei]